VSGNIVVMASVIVSKKRALCAPARIGGRLRPGRDNPARSDPFTSRSCASRRDLASREPHLQAVSSTTAVATSSIV
jgi:hypothetical protein